MKPKPENFQICAATKRRGEEGKGMGETETEGEGKENRRPEMTRGRRSETVGGETGKQWRGDGKRKDNWNRI